MKMIKQTAGYVDSGPIIGATGTTDGLMRLNYVVEGLCVHPSFVSWRSKEEKSQSVA